MKIWKKVLCSLLVVVMCLTSAPLSGFVGLELPQWNWKVSATGEKPVSGQCGDNAYWEFDESTGTLTISGTGSAWSGENAENSGIAPYVDYITSLVVEEGITELGMMQYYYPNLSDISLPDSLEVYYTSIFDYSAYCEDEKNWENDVLYVDDCFIKCKEGGEGTLVVREGTTRLPAFALAKSNYTDVILPESMQKISTGAFAYQTQLKSVQFDGKVEKIGDAAFGTCISLETIIGLESVKEIGIDAFGLCYKLKSIDLSETEKIGNMAFMGCISLEDIDLSSAKEIGEQAFQMCVSLDKVILPAALNRLCKEAFSNCLFLEEAYVYNPNMSFSENSLCMSYATRNDDIAKEDFASLLIDYYDATFRFLGSEDKSEVEAIMAEFEKHIIEYEAPQPYGTIVCYKGSTAETYAIENGINYRYFSDEEPERTVLATGQCGDNAFYTLYSDGELVVSGEGEMWDYSTQSSPFPEMDIIKVTVEDGITTIGAEAFKACYELESVVLSDSVKVIGDEAFYWCIELKDITLSENLETIGNMVFTNCWYLEEITIPASVKNIGYEVFTTCYQLKSITVDSNNPIYSSDDFGALFNKDKTVLVQYPIGNQSNTYEIPDTVKTIGEYSFSSAKKLEEIIIGENVTKIEHDAFNECTSFVDVVIPDNIRHISDGAFASCENLATVTIGKSVEQIDSGAFVFCVHLTDIYYNGKEQEWNKIEIDEDNQEIFNATIHFLGEECDHNPIEQTITASCTVNGMKFYICSECGDTVGETEIILAAHTPGEWETVLEPTYEAEGKKIKKCTVCGETVNEEIIPKLEMGLVEDEKTGVGIEYPADKYDGKVEIEVEESFDGTAFNILDTKTGAVQQKIYDIKMLVNGEETQPNGKITVKIPLPAGYNPDFSFVYYVNTETGGLEKMNATYEDGYMVFETDHFSYYAVIAEPDTDNCSCNCHKSGIAKFFFKFILFFQKIFKANKECKCGAAHY